MHSLTLLHFIFYYMVRDIDLSIRGPSLEPPLASASFTSIVTSIPSLAYSGARADLAPSNMLVHKYMLFKIESIESITNMFIRFIHIINNLKSLGKDYNNSELI